MRDEGRGGVESGFSEFGLCLDWKRRPQCWALRRIMEKRERRKGGLWTCVCPHRWSAHTDGGVFCVSKRVCSCALAELCQRVGKGKAVCARSMCGHRSVHLQMLAQTHVSFSL